MLLRGVNCRSPLPSPRSSSQGAPENSRRLPKDHVLNMSPIPSYQNPLVDLEMTLPGQSSLFWESEKALCFSSTTSILSNGSPASKSSAKLMKEIAALEVEIMHLERYLLSLYRTAFEHHLPTLLENHGTHLQYKIGSPLQAIAGQSHHRMEADIWKDDPNHHDQISPAHGLASSDYPSHAATPKFSSGRVNMPRDLNLLHALFIRILKFVKFSSLLPSLPFSRVIMYYFHSGVPIYLMCFLKAFIQVIRTVYEMQLQERKNADCHRSLADHLGASHTDNAFSSPDKLSEDIVRCISSIYCKLANPTATHTGFSVSSTSSFSSSSTFSPRNHLDGWSPHANEDATGFFQFKGSKEETRPYAAMIEVAEICLDDDSFNYAARILQNFRSLVKSLEKVDPRKMKREEKLAFWINVHNALVMHAYLAYGTHNYVRSTSVLKAAYNVGGHCINAYVIQSSILGIRSHYSAPWLQTLLSPGKKFKTGSARHAYAIEYPEPLVHFALCSGAYSDPAVRIYTAKDVFQNLKLAKEEFIQASLYIREETKIYLPKIVCYFAKDMSLTMPALLEMVNECLSKVQQRAIKRSVKGRHDKHIYWLQQSSTFRYVIHREVAEGTLPV